MTTANALKPVLLLGSFILLCLVGIGPSLHLISRTTKYRVGYALCLAPAVGLVVMCLLLYPLLLADQIISTSAVPLRCIIWIEAQTQH